VKKNLNHPDVCDYHSENIGWYRDGTHKQSMKELRHWYANSKWPKSLQR